MHSVYRFPESAGNLDSLTEGHLLSITSRAPYRESRVAAIPKDPQVSQESGRSSSWRRG